MKHREQAFIEAPTYILHSLQIVNACCFWTKRTGAAYDPEVAISWLSIPMTCTLRSPAEMTRILLPASPPLASRSYKP